MKIIGMDEPFCTEKNYYLYKSDLTVAKGGKLDLQPLRDYEECLTIHSPQNIIFP